jgi:DNA mismatch endonuclease, patch repair protein
VNRESIVRILHRSPAASSAAVSAVMRGNKSRHTRPERAVRRLLFVLGYRYRLHLATLPGRPDVSFPGRKRAIFVHGCFWHQHSSEACPLRSHPKSNVAYWRPKLQRNVERDASQISALKDMGWKIHVVWECETINLPRLRRRLRQFLGPCRAARV